MLYTLWSINEIVSRRSYFQNVICFTVPPSVNFIYVRKKSIAFTEPADLHDKHKYSTALYVDVLYCMSLQSINLESTDKNSFVLPNKVRFVRFTAPRF